MKVAETKFSFMANSPSILPQEVTRLIDSQMIKFDESQINLTMLADYVKSNATLYLSTTTTRLNAELHYLSRHLDPSALQLVKMTLSQAYDKL